MSGTTIVRPLAAALFIWTAGFAAMTILWLFGDWPDGLPGHFAFRSAVIGDGLILPTAAWLLVSATTRLPPGQNDRVVAVAATFAGIMAGATSQVLWLLDPDPVLNWTLPAPHTFNVAGWYHAAFLTATSGFLAGSVGLVLSRLHALKAADPNRLTSILASPVLALAGALPVGFAVLVFLDGLEHSSSTLSHRVSLVSVIAASAVALAALSSALGPWVMGALPMLGVGSVIALSGSLILSPAVVLGLTELTILGVAACGGLAAGAALPHLELAARRLLVGTAVATGLALPSVAAGWVTTLDLATALTGLLLGAFLVVFVVFTARGGLGGWRQAAADVTLTASILAILLVGLHLETHAPNTGLEAAAVGVIAAAVFVKVLSVGKREHRALMDFEGLGAIGKQERFRMFALVWARLTPLVVACVYALTVLTTAAAPGLGYDRGVPGPVQGIPVLAVVGGSLLTLIGAASVVDYLWGRQTRRAAPATTSWPHTASLRHPLSLLSAGGSAVWGYALWHYGSVDLTLLPLAIPVAAITFAWIFETILSNVAYLNGLQPRPYTWVRAVLAGFVGACSASWLVASGYWTTDGPAGVVESFAALGLVAFVCTGLVGALILVPEAGGRKGSLLQYPPVANVLHDTFLFWVLFMFVAWLPALLYFHVVGSSPRPLLSVIAISGPYLLLFGQCYFWAFENYTRHWHQERSKYTGTMRRKALENAGVNPEDADEIVAQYLRLMKRHIRLQRILSTSLLIPTAVGLLGYFANQPVREESSASIGPPG